ncbi:hypothetical protein LJR235_002897 [Pararhizobium sp. LjRoot235]|uniref:hypothetical protein n=1 Tax=Pararhizobium sp. LjRoot235 TaxID=3342291 RepID=UPI003ED03C4D
MADVEKEFFREGLPHDNQIWMTLVFDSVQGHLKVRTYRTRARGTSVAIEEDPLPTYLATVKHTKAKRSLKSHLGKLSIAIRDL